MKIKQLNLLIMAVNSETMNITSISVCLCLRIWKIQRVEVVTYYMKKQGLKDVILNRKVSKWCEPLGLGTKNILPMLRLCFLSLRITLLSLQIVITERNKSWYEYSVSLYTDDIHVYITDESYMLLGDLIVVNFLSTSRKC